MKNKTKKNKTRNIYGGGGGGGGSLFGKLFNYSQPHSQNKYFKHNKTRHHRHNAHLNAHHTTHHNHKNKIIIGKVSVSWCGHCQDLISVWSKMKTDKRIKNGRIQIIDINHESDDGKKMIENLNKEHAVNIAVNGYPTIFKIYNKKLFYFSENKDRNVDNIIHFALQK